MKNHFFQLAAAITFFTRIPIWKLVEIPVESYRKIIHFWPLTGWITGAVLAVSWLGFSMVFPPTLALILALLVRTLLTGGLHEDGLGDFFDGFGGGRTKADVLRIMKDSHIGSYALIGMIFYYLITITILLEIPSHLIAIVLFVGDPLSKFSISLLMNLLPYARTENESKSKTLFDKLGSWGIIIAGVSGLIPILLIPFKLLWISALTPFFVMLWITLYSKKKIGGYTGDVCGAAALLCELAFYITIYLLTKVYF